MAFPGTYNFDYYRGDTHEMVVSPKNSDGSNFDLTDYAAQYTIANVRGSTGTQYPQTTSVNTTLDTITCTIVAEDGRDLVPGTYVYDVQITNTTANPDVIFTVLTGTITVTDDITGAVI